MKASRLLIIGGQSSRSAHRLLRAFSPLSCGLRHARWRACDRPAAASRRCSLEALGGQLRGQRRLGLGTGPWPWPALPLPRWLAGAPEPTGVRTLHLSAYRPGGEWSKARTARNCWAQWRRSPGWGWGSGAVAARSIGQTITMVFVLIDPMRVCGRFSECQW